MILERLQVDCRNKKSLALVIALIMTFSMLAMGFITDKDTKSVILIQKDCFNDFESNREIVTRFATVGEFLLDQGVNIYDDSNIISAEPSSPLIEGQTVTVEKSKQITVICDGKTQVERVRDKYIVDALYSLGITLSDLDYVSPPRNSVVEDGITVSIDRICIYEDKKETEIPFQTITENDNNAFAGTKKIKQKGVKGVHTEIYNVKTINGVEAERTLVSSVDTVQPVNEIVVKGTKPKPSIRYGFTGNHKSFNEIKDDVGFSYSRVLTLEATAYDPSPETNAGYSRTAYGLIPCYGVVAVDPRVIPLGTKLYVESPDGGRSWVYGYCIAGDTGGAIKGNRIDLCYNTKGECEQFGRRGATVYVLN